MTAAGHRTRQDRFTRRQLLRYAAVVAGSASLLAACGRRGAVKGGLTPGAAGGSTAPRSGGVLNSAQKYDPASFDPSTKLSEARQVLNLTNDGLLRFKVGPDVHYTDYIVSPDLSERWEFPDAQTYTFHLHPGVRFANLAPLNGRALTSADIKWSLEFLSRTGALKDLPPAPSSSNFQGLDSIETPDTNTVGVHFGQPFAPFVSYIASEYSPMVAHEIFDQDGDLSKRTVGTGPWQLDPKSSQPGSHWTFRRNPDYFMAGLPHIDQVNWVIIADDASVDAAFLAKQVDMMDYSGMTLDTVNRVQKAAPGAQIDSNLGTEGTFIYMNASAPPLNDARIRKAFAYSINRDEFVQVFTAGKGDWALASGLPGLFSSQETRDILRFDPAEAKRMVADAGFPNGVDIEFIYPGLKYGQELVSKLQLLQSQVKKGGVNLTLKNVDQTTESKRRRTGDYQLAQSANAFLAAGDLDAPLYGLFDPKSSNNFSRVNDPKLTKLVEAQRREVDTTKRRNLWRQAVRYINEVPWALALVYEPRYAVWYPKLKQYARNAAYTGIGAGIIGAWLES